MPFCSVEKGCSLNSSRSGSISFLVLILIFHLHLHRLLLIIKKCPGITQYMPATRGRTRTRNLVQVQENEKEEDWGKDEEEHGRLVTPSGYSTFSAE